MVCTIEAPGSLAADLEWSVNFCAGQTGFPLLALARLCDAGDPVITLHLSPGQAAPDHPAWCLVCRLACLCPQARVGVLVHAAGLFTPLQPARARTLPPAPPLFSHAS